MPGRNSRPKRGRTGEDGEGDKTEADTAAKKQKASSHSPKKKTNTARAKPRTSPRTPTVAKQVMGPSPKQSKDNVPEAEKTNDNAPSGTENRRKTGSVEIPTSTLPGVDVTNKDVEHQSVEFQDEENMAEVENEKEKGSVELSEKQIVGKTGSVELPTSTFGVAAEGDGKDGKSVGMPEKQTGKKNVSVEIPKTTLTENENSATQDIEQKFEELDEEHTATSQEENGSESDENEDDEKAGSGDIPVSKSLEGTTLTEDVNSAEQDIEEMFEELDEVNMASSREESGSVSSENEDGQKTESVDIPESKKIGDTEDVESDNISTEDKSVLSLARGERQHENEYTSHSDDASSSTADSNESLKKYHCDQHLNDLNQQIQGIVSGKVKKRLPTLTEVCSEALVGLDFIIMLTLIQSSESCLLCQPKVNTRQLGIKQIDNKRFIDSMIGESGDIAEDMHAILYEITDENSEETVPIFPTYTTSKEQTTLLPLENKFAKYPTRESLLQMASAFGLKGITETTPDMIPEIFLQLNKGRSSELVHQLFTNEVSYGGTKKEVKSSPMKVTNNFLNLRKNLQSKHNIRIALLNGLHRSGLALHILGNYFIQNSTPQQSQKSLYQFSKNSMLNTTIGFHIFQEERQTYTPSFIKLCRQYSETVTIRKYDHVELTVRSQLYDLLYSKTKQSLLEKYFLPSKILTSPDVSTHCFLMEKKIILFLIHCLFFNWFQPLSGFQDDRFVIFEHNYKSLLSNFPIKKEYIKWRNTSYYPNLTSEEDIFNQTMFYLQELTPKKSIHLGRRHKSGTTKICRAPSNLLAILWLLQYSIYDTESLEQMITFFAPDTFKTNSKFANPDWLRQYILCPVVDVIDLLSNKTNLSMAADSYMTSRKHQFTKFTDFITYTLTTTMISILLKFGDRPLFHHKNINTMGIGDYLRNNVKNLARSEYKTKDIMQHCKSVYELFFTALPGLLEKNAEQHGDLIFRNFRPKTELGVTFFHKLSQIDEFVLHLPMKKEDKYESVTLHDYFQGILNGQISIEDLKNESPSLAKEASLTTGSPSAVIQGEKNSSQTHTEIAEFDFIEEEEKKESAKAKSDKPKKPRSVTEKVTVIIDEDTFYDTKETVDNQLLEIATMMSNREANSKEIITALKLVEKKTGDLFRKFEDAYKKKKK